MMLNVYTVLYTIGRHFLAVELFGQFLFDCAHVEEI